MYIWNGNTIIIYLACLFFIFLIGKIFIVPIKTILKIIANSVLGAIIIFIINLIGGYFNFHIGLNLITSILVGILGIPGAVLLVLLKMII